MATIATGKTFTAGEEVTHTDLNNAVNSATISGITVADLDSGLSAVTSAATAPTGPSEGDLWYDSTNDWLRIYIGTSWCVVGPTRWEAMFTLATGISATEGIGFMVDTGNAGKLTTLSGNSQIYVGTAAETIAAAGTGRIVVMGKATISVHADGTAFSVGDFVKADTTNAGYFDGGDSTRDGSSWYYGIALETIAVDSSGDAWLWGRPVK